MIKILDKLKTYESFDPNELEMKSMIIEFIENEENIYGKLNPRGHITASAWVVNEEMTHVLFTHHSKLDRWLQPGGHTEVGEDVLDGAIREAAEETGLKQLRVATGEIFDVDVHLIPARKETAAHYHYDIRYLIYASMQEELILTHESNDLKWFGLEELALMKFDASIQRMIDKTKLLEGRLNFK